MRPARSSFSRRAALGCTAVAVMAGGLLVATPAFADGAQTFADLQTAVSAGSGVVQLGADIDASGQTLQVPANATETLDLDGHTLRLDTLQLTTIDPTGAVEGANLTITDSTSDHQKPGSGQLTVAHESNSTTAAIEVDSASTLTVIGARVAASALYYGSAAGIGGGGLVDRSTSNVENAGTITISDGAVVSAAGSRQGAGIGGGRYGSATINVLQTANVTATGQADGDAAAIGSGAASASAPTIVFDGLGVNDTGGSGVVVSASTVGRGAAIGGGFHTAGGTIGIHDYSTVTATSSEAAIGDGEGATGSSAITIDGYSNVTALGGQNIGGAGIGSSNLAYGNDTVSIGGNSVVRASSSSGPGIGGERNRYSTAVSIGDSANVVAIGGGNGAGIGGGDSAGPNYQSGATLSLGGTADLTVGTNNSAISAIGAGNGSGTGTISLGGGVLHLGAGQQITVPSGSTFTNNSLFMNAGTLRTTGSGTISNNAVILNTGTVSGAVSGYAYTLSYNPGTGTLNGASTQAVFADTLQQAQLGLPTAVPSTPGSFVGWNTKSDGSGSYVNSSVSLSGLFQQSQGSPITVPLYAVYQLYPVLGGPALPNAAAHKSYSGSVATTSGTGAMVYTETGSFPAGLHLNGSTGAITGTPSTIGSYRFTVHVSNSLSRENGRSISRVYTLTVGKPLAAKLSATVKAKHGFFVRLTNLLWSEPLHIVQAGPAKATYNPKASKGAYTLTFKHGLAKKGKYTFTVTAKSTGRVLVIHLTVK